MCIITNQYHIVISISSVPNLVGIPDGYHVYFPIDTTGINVGDRFNPSEPSQLSQLYKIDQ